MRLLIDECLHCRICRHLSSHDCVSVQKMGWGGLKNGILLRKAEKEFDAFLTADRNLSFQQDVPDLDIAVLVLCSDSTQLRHLLVLMPKLCPYLNP